MLEFGLAVVYKGKDSKYGGNKALYISKEKEAKRAKRGVWKLSNFQTPADYKYSGRANHTNTET